MTQSPGVPPYGDPRHRPPADPYPGYDPYRGQEPTQRYGGEAGYPGGSGGYPQPGGRGHAAAGGHVAPGHRQGPPPGPWPGRTPPEPSGPWSPAGEPASPAPYPPARYTGGGGGDGGDPPATPSEPPLRRGRPRVGVLAGLAVLLVGFVTVGAWLLLRDPDRGGAPDPVAATQEFLQAVYRDFDPAAAAATVCSQARDEAALTARIEQIRDAARTYVEPTYSWSPPQVVEQTDERAVVAVTLTMATGDERMATLDLRLTVLDKGSNGWWVCDVATGSGPAAEPTGAPAPTGTPSPPAQEESGE